MIRTQYVAGNSFDTDIFAGIISRFTIQRESRCYPGYIECQFHIGCFAVDGCDSDSHLFIGTGGCGSTCYLIAGKCQTGRQYTPLFYGICFRSRVVGVVYQGRKFIFGNSRTIGTFYFPAHITFQCDLVGYPKSIKGSPPCWNRIEIPHFFRLSGFRRPVFEDIELSCRVDRAVHLRTRKEQLFLRSSRSSLRIERGR